MAFQVASMTSMRALTARPTINDIGTATLSVRVPSKRALSAFRPHKLRVAANDQAEQPSTSQAPPASDRTPDHLRVPILEGPGPARSFEELMGFSGAPERINGRLAMTAFALAYANEKASHTNIFEQFGHNPLAVFGLIGAISLASLAPQIAPWGSQDWNPDNDYGNLYGNSKLIQGRTVVFSAVFAPILGKLGDTEENMEKFEEKVIEVLVKQNLASSREEAKAVLEETFEQAIDRVGYVRDDWITPSTVEMWNGRAAMLGFVYMFLYEGCWGYPLF